LRGLIGITGLVLLTWILSFEAAPGAGAGVLDQDDVAPVDSIGGNRICFHTNTACVDSLRPMIVEGLKRAVREIGEILDVTDVEFRVVVFPERTLPSKGMSGAAPDGRHIYILLDPDHPRLVTSLRDELVAVIAHEYHHTLRNRTVGFGSNLFEAIISEGLAEHFCMEVTGTDPPWATQIPDPELAPWWERAEREWFASEYDYYTWFVGIGTEFPRGVGYSIGRRIVAEYLSAHPEERASTLCAAAAERFLPSSRPPSRGEKRAK
jgi:uncharacterized protein YjaZ